MNQLGDLLFSLPILYNLRKELNPSFISSVIKNTNLKDILELTPGLVDEILLVSLCRLSLLPYVIKKRFDLAIHLSQSLDAAILSYLTGIPKRVGFFNPPVSKLYNIQVKFTPPPSLENNLNLLTPLGIPLKKRDYFGLIEVPQKAFPISNLSKPLVIITPGSSKRRKGKRWNPIYTAKIIDYIISGFDASVIMIGTKEERSFCENIINNAKYKYKILNLVGKLRLKEVTSIISKADLIFGVDNGILHLATALGRNTLWLFGETDPDKIIPKELLNMHNLHIIKKETMQNITLDEVKSKLDLLLT
jgi:heptosyltransferase-2